MNDFDISDSPERKRNLYRKEQIEQYIFEKYKDEKIAVAHRIAKELNISLLQAEMMVIKMKQKQKEG